MLRYARALETSCRVQEASHKTHLHDVLHTNGLEGQIERDGGEAGGCRGEEAVGSWEVTARVKFPFQGDKHVLTLTVMRGTQFSEHTEAYTLSARAVCGFKRAHVSLNEDVTF